MARWTRMEALRTETIPIKSEEDIVLVRKIVRERAIELRFNILEQTKVVTAASELARNTLIHGGGGDAKVSIIERDFRNGLELEFVDCGPGISNIELAMTPGYTTGRGMGLGLSGSKRLMSEFEIVSVPGKGTRVTTIRWK
jgi:serine/threonine-protein kinase RsbT